MVFLGRRSRTKSDLSLKMYQEEIQVGAWLTTLRVLPRATAWEGQGAAPQPSEEREKAGREMRIVHRDHCWGLCGT